MTERDPPERDRPDPTRPPLEEAGARDAMVRLLASLDYRLAHIAAGAPEGFGRFDAGAGVRTPSEIARHVAGLLAFARSAFEDASQGLEPLPSFVEEVDRARAEVARLARALASGASARSGPGGSGMDADQAWRGPVADALTHVGQLATLRRLAGAPVERVRYWAVEMPDPA